MNESKTVYDDLILDPLAEERQAKIADAHRHYATQRAAVDSLLESRHYVVYRGVLIDVGFRGYFVKPGAHWFAPGKEDAIDELIDRLYKERGFEDL